MSVNVPLRSSGWQRFWSNARLAQYGGLGFLAVAVIAVSLLAAPGAAGMLGACLGVLMLAVAAIDARHFIIPNALTAAAFALALVNAAIGDGWDAVFMASLRGAGLGAIFLALRAAYQRLRGRQGIGLGDVKLAAVAGAWLGWMMLPIAIEITALAALAVYTLRWSLGGGAVTRITRVPFGLFLAPVVWMCWLIEMRFALI